ncbi:MAG TPA: glycosyltransferase [Candidatus Acidoferrales bacterium]|nr:glycosyltransferase [Candidatus Acidoferrales bacterium]
MKRIDFVFFDAGGGHRSAATALARAIEQRKLPWEIRLLNLQEALDPLDELRNLTGVRIQDLYNRMLRSGWTLGSRKLMRMLQAGIRAYHGKAVRHLEKYWRERAPDMVVSFVPHFNRALCESYRNVFPGRPFVTILTDIADYPPHFWIERQEQYLVCGSARAVEQARALGHAADRVFRASGMIVHPRFYEPQPADRAGERRRAGLDPELPTGLVLFGGHGSRAMLEIARRLDRSQLNVQLILLCGRNEELARALRGEKLRLRRRVEGFTERVPYWMHLSDFFIGKAGPGSLSEAMVKGLPAIVECNAWTLPQERYNAQWIRERGVGLVAPNFRRIDRTVGELLRPEAFARFRENTRREPNCAVFEIPGFLERILERG